MPPLFWVLVGSVTMAAWDRRDRLQWWALFLWHKALGHHR